MTVVFRFGLQTNTITTKIGFWHCPVLAEPTLFFVKQRGS